MQKLHFIELETKRVTCAENSTAAKGLFMSETWQFLLLLLNICMLVFCLFVCFSHYWPNWKLIWIKGFYIVHFYIHSKTILHQGLNILTSSHWLLQTAIKSDEELQKCLCAYTEENLTNILSPLHLLRCLIFFFNITSLKQCLHSLCS